jgi:hypothetical protein
MAGGEYRAEKRSAGPTSFPAGEHLPWKIPGYAPGPSGRRLLEPEPARSGPGSGPILQ